MPHDLEKKTDFDINNDAYVAQAESLLHQAVKSLQTATEASRKESHNYQAGALEAIARELEEKANVLSNLRRLKD